MAAKAVFAIQAADKHLDIDLHDGATIHVWWLNITLIMSAVFGFAEHSLCVAWAATFRGERWIELSNYGGSNAPGLVLRQQQSLLGPRRDSGSTEPLLSSDSGQLYP